MWVTVTCDDVSTDTGDETLRDQQDDHAGGGDSEVAAEPPPPAHRRSQYRLHSARCLFTSQTLHGENRIHSGKKGHEHGHVAHIPTQYIISATEQLNEDLGQVFERRE